MRGPNPANRAAILKAARRCFASAPYDQVGLRDIAAAAGLDKRVLARHFASKALLFAEALEAAKQALPAPGPVARDPGEVLREVLEPGGRSFDERSDYLSLCLNGINSTESREIARVAIEQDIRQHAANIQEPEPALRASMVLAVLFGLTLLREIAHAEPIAGADPEAVIRHTAPLLRTAVAPYAD